MPLLTAGEFNQGVKEFISNQNQQIFNNAITIDMFCNSFVHIEKFCCDDNILVLNPKELMNKYHLRFISTIINKDKSKYGYGKQYRIGSLENHKISLPTIDSAIAFEFMENYIKELEVERIKELEAYLQVTGLKNYTLSAKEKEALNAFEAAQNERERERVSGTPLKWREFKIGELFEIVLSSGDNKANKLPSGKIPLISAGESNNGVTKYIKHGDGKAQIFPANIITTDMFGNFFYQPREFYAVSHGRVNMLIPKNDYFTQFNRFIGTFLCAFSFKFRAIFGFSNMLSKTKIEKETLNLPTINGTIAFEFMETFISAVQKEVIKSVVLWSEKRLNATKQVISKPL